MKHRIILVICLSFVVAGVYALPLDRAFAQEQVQAVKAKGDYYCPMHPDYTSDNPGSCPICGMNLVKRKTASAVPTTKTTPPEKKERKVLFYRNPMDPTITSPVPMKDSMGMDYVPVYAEAAASTTSAGVSVSIEKQQLIGLKKSVVEMRRLAVPISTVGKVAYDPELYVAQEVYLQAVKAAYTGEKNELASVREESADFLASSERKLLLSGMAKEEIAKLKESGMPQEGLYLPSSSGKSWVYLTVYAGDLGLVKPGQEVVVDSSSWPGEAFKGKVAGVAPVLDSVNRSARLRAEVSDPDGKLKPEMFLNARIDIDLGEKLAVPASAVMDTGLRKIVYVVKDDMFSPREVKLGPKAGAADWRAEPGSSEVPAPVRPAGEYYEVLGGIEVGEEVVTSGNFLIDSESRMKGAL